MKHFNRLITMFLALLLFFTCIIPTFSAIEFETQMELSQNADVANNDTELSDFGFNSIDFKQDNTYRYGDNEIVRAIVILEGMSEAEVGGVGSTKSATQRVKLINQHTSVFKAMENIEYDLKFEYTRLLNGFSCDVRYGDLEYIAGIDGVVSVHIANYYDQPVLQDSSATKQNTANSVVGNDLMYNNQWNGRGTVVAVLDTGLNVNHEAFQYYTGMVDEVVTQETISTADVYCDGIYLSAKVPFAFDYADYDTDVNDVSAHGTHVSGSAVGLAGEFDGDSFNATFVGAAPCAQLLCMKIFPDSGGGASSDIYFYAMEDAYALGADVINLSIGSQNGFTYDSSLETRVFGNIYQTLSDAGVFISISAGNQRSMTYYASNYHGYSQTIGPEYTDYGTVSSPSTFEGAVSVASKDNPEKRDFTIEIDGEVATFTDSCADGLNGWVQTFGGTDASYLLIESSDGSISTGISEDLQRYSSSLDGKIAVVSRGGLSFEEIIENVADAGAVGCIVVNNQEGILSMSVETFEIPAISLQQSSLELFSASGTINTSAKRSYITDADASLMSLFSNWGTSPMLTLDPTITAMGGNIYSAIPGGTNTYDEKSGTSMAAPNMSGLYASLLGVIYQKYPNMEKPEAAELAKDLIYSSAILLFDGEGYHYSPRKVGVGLGSAWNATQILQEAAYITNPIFELGDDPNKTGVYTMSIELKNPSNRSLLYTDFEAYVLFDKLISDDNGILRNAMSSEYAYMKDDSLTDYYGRGASVSYRVGGAQVTQVELAAGKSVTVDVTVTLTQAQKDLFDANYPNGSFVEGYIVFNEVYEGETRSSNHATFLAYYGDWTQASAMEAADFEDVIRAEIYLNNTIADTTTGQTYAEQGHTWKDSDQLNFYTNPNMAILTDSSKKNTYSYAGAGMLGYELYYPDHISFTTPASDSDRSYGTQLYMEPYLLRNVESLTLTIYDKESGEVYYTRKSEYRRKASYKTDQKAWSPSCTFSWNGTNQDGVYVPSGTVATVTYDAVLPYGHTEQNNVWSFDVTVDYVAPVIRYSYNNTTNILKVTGSDEHYLQALYLESPNGDIIDARSFSSNIKGKSFTATFDIGTLSSNHLLPYVNICALDYATNITIEKLSLPQTPTVTVLFSCPAGVSASPIVTNPGTNITLPTPNGTPTDTAHTYSFAGWVTSALSDTSTKPTIYNAGQSVLVESDQTFHALYTYKYIIFTKYTTIPQSSSVGSNTGKHTTMYRVYNEDALNSDSFTFMVKSSNGTFYTMGNQEDGSYIALFSKAVNYASAPASVMVGDEFLFNVSYSNGAMTIKDHSGNYLYGNVDAEGYVRLDWSTTACTWTPTFNSDGSFSFKSNEGYYLSLRDDFETTGTNGFPLFMVSSNLNTGSCNFFLYRSVETNATCKHSYTAIVTAPTCTEGGYTTYTCSKCGISYIDDIISDPSHVIVTQAAVAPTCTQAGLTEGKYCSACGLILVAQEEVSATGHSYTSKVTTAATCGMNGVRTYTCSKCNDSYTETIPKTNNHSYTSKITKAATCEESGIRTYTCSMCSYSYTVNIAALGHNYTSTVYKPTCTTAGYTDYSCSNCGDRYTVEGDAAIGHSYTSVVTYPSCTVAGCTTYTCTNCGDSYNEPISATGHSFTSRVADPTCTKEGYMINTCSICDYSYAEVLPAKGHSYTYSNNADNHTVGCNNCDYSITEEHTYTNGSCICGAEEVTGPIPASELVFMNKALSLQSYIAFDCYVTYAALEGYDSWYVVFERYDYEKGTTVTETVSGEDFFAYAVRFEYKVNSYQMADTINATIYAVKDGKTYVGETYTNSVAGYVNANIANASSDAHATVYANLVTYGAKAQVYMKYNVENLADAGLGEYASYVTTTVPTAESVFAQTNNGLNGAQLASINLGISAAVEIQTTITLSEGYSLQNIYGEMVFVDSSGKTVTQRVEGTKFDDYGFMFIGRFNAMTAVDGRVPVEITIYDLNGNAISETWTYSVASYLDGTTLTGDALATLYALVNYYDSAAVFFNP